MRATTKPDQLLVTLAEFGMQTIPSRLIASQYGPGLGICAENKRLTLAPEQLVIVGEFIGKPHPFPTPHQQRCAFETNADRQALVYDDTQDRKNQIGAHFAGQCQKSRLFANAFKINIKDPHTKALRYFLVTTGRVVQEKQELTMIDGGTQWANRYLPPWSVANIGAEMHQDELDNLSRFMQQQPEDLSLGALAEQQGQWGDRALTIEVNQDIISQVSLLINNISQCYLSQVIAQNGLVRHWLKQQVVLQPWHRLMDYYYCLGSLSLTLHQGLNSKYQKEQTLVKGLVLAETDYHAYLKQEAEGMDALLASQTQQDLLAAKNWQTLLSHYDWQQSIQWPHGFNCSQARDMQLLRGLNDWHLFCYRCLSVKGDANHYLKAMAFMQNFHAIACRMKDVALASLPGHEEYSQGLVELMRQASNAIAHGLKIPAQHKGFFTCLAPSAQILLPLLERTDTTRVHCLRQILGQQNGQDLFKFMTSYLCEQMQEHCMHMQCSGMKPHVGMERFYKNMIRQLQAFASQYHDTSDAKTYEMFIGSDDRDFMWAKPRQPVAAMHAETRVTSSETAVSSPSRQGLGFFANGGQALGGGQALTQATSQVEAEIRQDGKPGSAEPTCSTSK